MNRLYVGSYPIQGGVSLGIEAHRFDGDCSPAACGIWTYRLAVDLFVRGFEIEWTPVLYEYDPQKRRNSQS